MFKFKPKESNYFIKLFQNLLIHKNIVVLLGDQGTSLAALDNNKIIDTHFIQAAEGQIWSKYQQFFNKYKNYSIFFLLDNNDCIVKRELIPILQSVIKVDPAQAFIDSHIPIEDISAYNVYSVSSVSGEVWNTMICSLPYGATSFKLIEYVINNFNFAGVYFLNLEYQGIIDDILIKTDNLKFSFHLQIFTTITDSGNIKFVIKHKREIIAIKNVDYRYDKSEAYAQGIIEQQITDYLISFKSYITRFELRVCLIFLVTDSIKTLLMQSNFGENSTIILTPPDINISVNKKTFKFLDNAVLEIFAATKSFLGLNKSIKSISQLNLLNRVVFKPFIITSILLVGVLLNIKYSIWQNQNNTFNLNTQYFEISNEYYNLKQRYPNISDITNLADLYSLEAFLKIPFILPFDLLNYAIKNLPVDARLDKINFYTLNLDSAINSSNVKFEIKLSFPKKNENIQNTDYIENYIKKLQLNFNNFIFDYSINPSEFDNNKSDFISAIIKIREN